MGGYAPRPRLKLCNTWHIQTSRDSIDVAVIVHVSVCRNNSGARKRRRSGGSVMLYRHSTVRQTQNRADVDVCWHVAYSDHTRSKRRWVIQACEFDTKRDKDVDCMAAIYLLCGRFLRGWAASARVAELARSKQPNDYVQPRRCRCTPAQRDPTRRRIWIAAAAPARKGEISSVARNCEEARDCGRVTYTPAVRFNPCVPPNPTVITHSCNKRSGKNNKR